MRVDCSVVQGWRLTGPDHGRRGFFLPASRRKATALIDVRLFKLSRHRSNRGMNGRNCRKSAGVFLLLLGLWLGAGMHLVHPFFHGGFHIKQTECCSAAMRQLEPAGGCHRCGHDMASPCVPGQARLKLLAVANRFDGVLAGGVAHDSLGGMCPICSFLVYTGQWLCLISALSWSCLGQAERLVVRAQRIFLPCLDGCFGARAPPALSRLAA